MDSREIKKQLDDLCGSHGLSKLIKRVQELEQSHLYMVSKEYGRFVNQFGLFFDVINEIMLGANYIPKEDWPKHRSLQYILINHNIKFLYSSFDQLTKGFWENSFVLSRPAYEAFIRVLYVSLHPEDSDTAFVEQKGKRKFNVTNFIRDELNVDWNDYKFYSVVSHSNKYKVLRDYVQIVKDGQKEPIVIKHKFEELEFEMGLNLLVFLCVVYLRMSIKLIATSYNESLPESLVQKAGKLADLWQNMMKTHTKRYWPQVANDIDKVFDKIISAEKIKD